MDVAVRTVVFVSALFLFTGCSASRQPSPLPDRNTATGNLKTVEKSSLGSTTVGSSAASGRHRGFFVDSDENETVPSDTSLGDDEGGELSIPDKKVQSILDEALDSCQNAQDCWGRGELDNALDALDQAYALILEVNTQNNPKLIQQKEDLRIAISKRIQEIYASRNIVVNGNHNEIPMELNEHVKKEIRSFQGGERDFFLAAYQRSGKYRDRIIKALQENGLPEQLSWLPLIESGFNVKALSPARALGLWQFIPSTGYKFGLKRDTYIDERLDPEKSTTAAIAYLTELHLILGDWMTVLASYNCGENRVLRVIREQNVNYLDNFWDLYQLLPRETARYVPRFLATLQILNDPQKYGFVLPEPDPPLVFETVLVNRQVGLTGISKELNIPEKELKALNPELRYGLLPAEPYMLRMPPGKKEMLTASIDRISVSHPPQATDTKTNTKHRVRSGETLSIIAARYHTSVDKIMRANNLKKSNYIFAGQTLKIPVRGTGATSATTTIAKNSRSVPKSHIVNRGDSLWNIAKRYGTTVKRIQTLNGLTTTALNIGQRLEISGSVAATTSEAVNDNDTKSLRAYVVKKGDSPFAIAKKNNTTLEKLLQLNQLSKRSTIHPGQTLYLD